jgi:hypothetical protein
MLPQRKAFWRLMPTKDLSACFNYFGAAPAPRHFSGSAISHDGKTVVVTMWEDELERQNDRVTYQSRYPPITQGQSNRANKKWIANLKWARDHCDSPVRVVVLVAKNPQARPKTLHSCYPHDTLVMRITHFDTRTGAFRAESA